MKELIAEKQSKLILLSVSGRRKSKNPVLSAFFFFLHSSLVWNRAKILLLAVQYSATGWDLGWGVLIPQSTRASWRGSPCPSAWHSGAMLAPYR